jgi:integrase
MTIDDGTLLLDVCEKLYFRLNTAIRHDNTRRQYRIAVGNLGEAVERRPTVADLVDDNVALMMRLLSDRGLANRTINERRNRVQALWNWLARRGHVARWPTVGRYPAPRRTPEAWTREQLRALFDEVLLLPGKRKGIPRWLWWRALLGVLWDSGARIGEIMAAEWSHLDVRTGWLSIPAEIRKGGLKDMPYRLSPDTLMHLVMLRRYGGERLFTPIYSGVYLWQAFGGILESAGLPHGRRDKFHRLRRSFATHLKAAGGNPQEALGHSTYSTTLGYLDPRMQTGPAPCELLFRPDRGPDAA